VLVLSDGEVVVGFDFDLTVGDDRHVFFGFELGVAVGFDAVAAFVANADLLVVLDVLVPVALGVDKDLLGALAVPDAQFVIVNSPVSMFPW